MGSALLKKVDLNTVGGGAAPELFQRELDKIAENIGDQNTDATATRKITMTFTFKPDLDRRETVVMVQAKSTMASVKPARNTIYCGTVDGQLALVGHDPDQMELDMQSDGVEHIVDGRKVRRPHANG
jgi:hypothetical protein